VIYLGIDDTDMPDSPGTNQIAKTLATHLAGRYSCELIVRHQLLQDPRVPFTSKNSAASMLLLPHGCRGDPPAAEDLRPLIDLVRDFLAAGLVDGSDPGFCVASDVPADLSRFGRRCQGELFRQQDARDLARRTGVHLEGIGGTEGGVIGALAAVGLAATGNDGRVAQIGRWPDDLSGPQPAGVLSARGVDVRCLETDRPIATGTIDVGKHLRPNYRHGKVVLFARPAAPSTDEDHWQAVRLT
jgi:hypothetical protein